MAGNLETAGQTRRRRGIAAVAVIVGTSGAMVTGAPVAHAEAVAPPAQLGSMYSVVDQIGARALWDAGVTGRGVNVAVVDTGVAPVQGLTGADKVVAVADMSLEAVVPGATFLDTYGHGTHMAGIIAGRDPGADPAVAREHPEWFLGVAPDAGLVSVKVGDATGNVDVSQVIAGIDWVIEHSAELDIRVMNLSFSSKSLNTYQTDPLTHAVERAWRAGIVVVVAAGNDGLGELQLSSPAMDPFVIAVGGLAAADDGTFAPADWSTNGNLLRNPDIGAPGERIVSLRDPGSSLDNAFPGARIGDRWFRGSGSSQAAAVTTGAVALLLAADPTLTPDEVKAVLTRSADPSVLPPASAVRAGHGLLRVDAALTASRQFAQQPHLPALGTGTLAGARGSEGLTVLGISTGIDLTILGSIWKGATWNGTRWSGGTWDGTRWSNARWMGTRWSDATWTGAAWVGESWTGVEWTGTRWSGTRWSGTRWSGTRWSGAGWSGTRWSGTRWSGTRWSGNQWT